MSCKFYIYTSRQYTKMDVKGEATNLDILLAMSAMFDRLEPESKELVLSKLQLIKDAEKDKLLSSEDEGF
ncbi:MAG: hypothetical protein SPI36_05680 [Candidatus Onthovivens sp.]|nr:hypothetical protein [Candidatus Onthovivens sp.]